MRGSAGLCGGSRTREKRNTFFFPSLFSPGSNKQVCLVAGFLVKWMFKALKPHILFFDKESQALGEAAGCTQDLGFS